MDAYYAHSFPSFVGMQDPVTELARDHNELISISNPVFQKKPNVQLRTFHENSYNCPEDDEQPGNISIGTDQCYSSFMKRGSIVHADQMRKFYQKDVYIQGPIYEHRVLQDASTRDQRLALQHLILKKPPKVAKRKIVKIKPKR